MRWAQLQILTWELRHDFIFNFFFSLPCCGAVCPLWNSFKWLPGTWREKKKNILLGFFFFYFTNRRTCNAGEGFDTESLFLSLLSQQKEPQTTLPGRWRGGMMTSPSRMPELGTWRGNSKELKVWVAQRRKWGNSAASSAPTTQEKEFVQLWGCLQSAKGLTGVQGNFCFVISPSAKRTNTTFPLPQPAGKTPQAELCCCRSVATINLFSGLSCGWSPDAKCGANSLAFVWLKEVSVLL